MEDPDKKPKDIESFWVESNYEPTSAARTVPTVGEPSKSKSAWKPWHKAVMAVLLVLIIVAAWLNARDAGTRGGLVAVGQEGRLGAEGVQGQVPVFPYQQLLDQFVEARVANDRTGIYQALAGAWAIPQGTRVLVIAHAGFGKRRVRILEGTYTGQAGFTYADWIQPANWSPR